MKIELIFLIFMMGYSCTSPSPKAKKTLDGHQFLIESTTGGKSEGSENMMFNAGQVENDVCKQWGFGKAAYTIDDNGHFKFSLTSEKEGRMDWEGNVHGSFINGQYVWIKSGQDDIHYTFEGKEVK
ncbi:MAG: hypothetical protein U0V49_00275 [Saprospiraceae bacterium]|mgnify:CR=1 FL=1